MPSDSFDRGFIIFDKSRKSRAGLDALLAKYAEPAPYVVEWLSSDNDILLWVLAVAPEQCRVITVLHANDLLIGALQELADQLGVLTGRTRVATGPLEKALAGQVRQIWRELGGVVLD